VVLGTHAPKANNKTQAIKTFILHFISGLKFFNILWFKATLTYQSKHSIPNKKGTVLQNTSLYHHFYSNLYNIVQKLLQANLDKPGFEFKSSYLSWN